MAKDGAIRISTHEYAIEFSVGWIHLTRYLKECSGCTHFDYCKEWNVDYTYSDCNYEAIGITGYPLSDTYDFNAAITQSEYPEFDTDEIAIINKIITDHAGR